MSKAHKAILDSLRQPHGVQTKGIQSSEACDDLCWNDSQPSPPCDSGTASQLCYPEQTAAQQMLGSPMLIYALLGHSPCVIKSLSRGRGSWKIAWVFSQSPENTLGSADQAERAVLVQHHLQPARVVWETDTCLQAKAWIPAYSATQTNLCRYTAPLLRTWWPSWWQWEFQVRLSLGPFLLLSFKLRFFWLVAPSSTWPATAFPQLSLESRPGCSSHTYPGGRSACA